MPPSLYLDARSVVGGALPHRGQDLERGKPVFTAAERPFDAIEARNDVSGHGPHEAAGRAAAYPVIEVELEESRHVGPLLDGRAFHLVAEPRQREGTAAALQSQVEDAV